MIQSNLNKKTLNAQFSQQELNRRQDALARKRELRQQEINRQEREASRKEEAIKRRREQRAEFDK